jgi:hypothetical protein
MQRRQRKQAVGGASHSDSRQAGFDYRRVGDVKGGEPLAVYLAGVSTVTINVA